MKPSDFLYQRSGRYFAQVAHGLREAAAEELQELGAEKTGLARAGLHVHADRSALYRILYESRLVTRILAPLIVFDCHSDRYLYKTAHRIDWPSFLPVDSRFLIVANTSDSALRHSLYASQVLKDAVVDRFREATGARPSVDRNDPDWILNLHVHRDRATISLDLGGGSLHKRGYRVESVEAPMQETLAAAVIRETGWDGETPLVDPFCGSGTLLAEALMRVGRIPAGSLRARWAVEHLPDFDAETWKAARAAAHAGTRTVPADLLRGSDLSADACAAARANLARLPGGRRVTVRKARFQDLEPLSGVTIVTNPPYGIRLENRERVEHLMKELGDFLKQKCSGSTAWLFFGERELLKSVGLKSARKIPLRAGGLDGRLVKYDLW